MTLQERIDFYKEKMEARKRKEREKKKAELEKRRVKGYNAYIRRKRREKIRAEEERRKEKEKRRAEKEKQKRLRASNKKIGRPKKRGPKKKRRYAPKKTAPARIRPVIDYKVVFCLNGRQNGYYGAYHTIEEAYSAINGIMEGNSSVKFPRMVVAGGAQAVDEVLLLEKNRDGSKENAGLRNEFGKVVQQNCNLKKWVIYDKRRIYVEETFWIYGKDPRLDRKTYSWILENIVDRRLLDKSDFIRICLYLNKIVFQYDDGGIDIVFCKTMSESVRLYNALLSDLGTSSNVLFQGSFSDLGPMRRNLEDKLMDVTGWSKEQLRRRKTKK